jgi:hypothetical protein
MGANQNSSREFDLCPKIDPTRLSSNSITTETQIDAGKNTCKTMATKIRPKISSSPHRYFIEHLADMFGKPPCESDLDLENLSFLIQ